MEYDYKKPNWVLNTFVINTCWWSSETTWTHFFQGPQLSTCFFYISFPEPLDPSFIQDEHLTHQDQSNFSGNLWLQIRFIHFLFLNFLFYFTLQYCIGFAIHWHESATGVHEFPNMNPPPTSHPISSLWFPF